MFKVKIVLALSKINLVKIIKQNIVAQGCLTESNHRKLSGGFVVK